MKPGLCDHTSESNSSKATSLGSTDTGMNEEIVHSGSENENEIKEKPKEDEYLRIIIQRQLKCAETQTDFEMAAKTDSKVNFNLESPQKYPLNLSILFPSTAQYSAVKLVQFQSIKLGLKLVRVVKKVIRPSAASI